MSGAIAATTMATEMTRWFCRFHFSAKAERWTAITSALRAMSPEQRDASLSVLAESKKIDGYRVEEQSDCDDGPL